MSSFSSILSGNIKPALLGSDKFKITFLELRFDKISIKNLALNPISISLPSWSQESLSFASLEKSRSSDETKSSLPLTLNLTWFVVLLA